MLLKSRNEQLQKDLAADLAKLEVLEQTHRETSKMLSYS